MSNFLKTSFFILYWPSKFLFLGSKIIQIIIFILNTLRGRAMPIQIPSMRIQNTSRATSASFLCSYWLIQGKVDHIG
jgi:hypothetical protein